MIWKSALKRRILFCYHLCCQCHYQFPYFCSCQLHLCNFMLALIIVFIIIFTAISCIIKLLWDQLLGKKHHFVTFWSLDLGTIYVYGDNIKKQWWQDADAFVGGVTLFKVMIYAARLLLVLFNTAHVFKSVMLCLCVYDSC